MMLLPEVLEAPSDRADQTARNIYDSFAWWNHIACGVGRVGSLQTNFGKENGGRNIVLTLNVDGVSPFDSVQKSYTPMQCMILNLPENLRHRSPFMLLPALIPGPRKPKHIQPYLSLLVQELKRLYEEGFDAKDPISKKTVRIKVKLLSTNCDLPAHADNNEQQGHAATYGCIKCECRVSLQRACNAAACAAPNYFRLYQII